MTAQITIMNRNALAIATDSAVTTRDPRGTKIHNTANKLFALSKYHPVALMIYQSADFMGFPWETLIKVYRKQLGSRAFAKLSDYAEDFFAFLTHQEMLREADPRDVWLRPSVTQYVGAVNVDFREHIQTRMNEGSGELTEDEAREIIALELGKAEVNLERLPFLSVYESEEIRERFKVEASEVVAQSISDVYGETLPPDLFARFKALIFLRFLKDSSVNYSGVVFAGYGEKELLPVVASYWVDGIFDGILRRQGEPGRSRDLNKERGAFIVPFAQSDSVYRFLQGIDPAFRTEATGLIEEMSKKLQEGFLTANSAHFPDEASLKAAQATLTELAREEMASLVTQINDLQSVRFLGPVMDVVEGMPKEELAAIAEALVNLTSFQTRIRRELETVGGPIDVAVISKGDGLIWIKRKHYFEPGMNQSFFANYYRDDDGN